VAAIDADRGLVDCDHCAVSENQISAVGGPSINGRVLSTLKPLDGFERRSRCDAHNVGRFLFERWTRFLSALVKILATTGALSFGLVGGPIFPLLFIGGSMGTVAHLALDGIPLGLAVVAMMAAVPFSVIPVPLSVATLTVLIAGIPPSESPSVFVAAIAAMIAGRLIESMLPKPAGATTDQ
jgi:H+/Cl- antiporter ClcA